MKTENKSARILALCAAAVIMSATAGAALVKVSPDDVKLICAGLLGAGKLTAACDINLSGHIDCADAVISKRAALFGIESGEPVTVDYAATEENVKLIGRTCRKKDVTWLVHSGAAAEFTVTGESAVLTLAGDGSVYSDEKYRPRYAVYVDGELLTDALMSAPELVIPLFEGETQRTATVKVIHLSEANNGAVGIRNLSVTSALTQPVRPTAKKKLMIEFIGDSITCAYGVEGANQYEGFSTSTENFTKSYAYFASELLDADYSAVSYSGYGIVSGYTSDAKNTDSLLPDCYQLVGKPADYAVEWDFEAVQNDVVVINLGTNDNSYLSKDMEGRSAEFKEGYMDFLRSVRKLNPEAYIICTMGTMGGKPVYDLIAEVVDEYKTESGDSRILSYLSAEQSQANGLGSDWHPSEITQKQSAYVLVDRICQALGMPSDRVGLDAAADGVYDITVNEAAGAGASIYVGYDKSFWINMVSGGTKSDDIKAYIDSISLLPGEYRLEFDCTTTGTHTIPYAVQHKDDPKRVYCSGTIDAPADKLHISETFKITEEDDDCEIAFLLGGEDYYNATFSSVTMFKLS